MSSILKALKKLENESPDKTEARFWQQTKFTGKAAHKGARGGPRFQKNPFLILGALLIALSIGLILSLKPERTKPNLVKKIESPPAKVTNTLKKKALGPGRINTSTAFEKHTRNINPNRNVKKKPSISHEMVRTKGRFSADKTKTKPFGPSNTKKTKPKRIQRQTIHVKRKEKPGQKPKIDTYASIPVKQSGDSKLELQAIAWSSNPKSRLAVINGHVVREGESIDSVFLIHIGKDEVILKKGMEKWKQMFRFK